MEDYFISEVSPGALKKEKAKARELRASQWWKRKKSEGICYYCHEKFKPADLTMDHLVPLIRGGKNSRGNVVPACKACNAKKKYHLPIEAGMTPDRENPSEDLKKVLPALPGRKNHENHSSSSQKKQ